MAHYFISATTGTGPWHFAVATWERFSGENYTIAEAIRLECINRKIVICSDWIAEPIDPAEFTRLTT